MVLCEPDAVLFSFVRRSLTLLCDTFDGEEETEAAFLNFAETEFLVEGFDIFGLGIDDDSIVARFRREFFDFLHGVGEQDGSVFLPPELYVHGEPADQPAGQEEVAGELARNFRGKLVHGQGKGRQGVKPGQPLSVHQQCDGAHTLFAVPVGLLFDKKSSSSTPQAKPVRLAPEE